MDKFQIKGAPTCRVVYVDGLFEKRQVNGIEGDPKYNAIIIVPKNDKEKIDQINAAFAEAFKDLQSKGCKVKNVAGLNPKNVCWSDGDIHAEQTENPAFAGYMLLKVASKNFRPLVVDMQKRIITNGFPLSTPVSEENISPEMLGSGDYVFANVSFWTYTAKAQGIGCNIHAIMRVKEGERIGGMSHNVDDYIEIQGYE